ncbi:MAG: ParB/RepB/Spo0J family partition protein [Ruminococcus sp.]|nr:ParB/RepB/Spo0J family partition protein [Ruminococcus sp.]MCM1380832.1 ParB/RepB/Spo0J family partition protein [Muribaculaceae bacterium]MCM1480020.1 ParB/RepB/Spo0J family partition protein [Muribaculaceae bacterium]
MQKYICKCGKMFEKSTNAETTGYAIKDYSPQHECYGCLYIVTERDWKTREIVKRECRATPKITYLSRCKIGTEKGDFSACRLYSLDLVFVKRVMNYINSLDGMEITEFGNRIPNEWRAADFGQCYSFDDCYGLAVFDLSFKKNKQGTEARRLVKERFFYEDGSRRDMTEDIERKTVLMRIEIAKENAGNKTIAVKKANEKTEETTMSGFNINAFITQQEQLKQISIDLLIPYHNHKFQLYTGERLEDMVNSIKANGVLTPIIVRPAPNNEGKYEILAGHNRCNAAKMAGLTAVPGIVKEKLSDEEAEMYVIETNTMQRGFTDLSVSEQAAVIAMRHSRMFDPAKRDEIARELNEFENADGEDAEKKSKLAITGEEYSLSKNTVARLIRINTLLEICDKFTYAVNTKKDLSVRAAVELSYIHKNALEFIFDKYKSGVTVNDEWCDTVIISMSTAEWLREIFTDFRGTKEQAEKLFYNANTEKTKKNIDNITAKPIKLSIPSDTFRKYFDEETKPDEAADIIDKALEMYFSQNPKEEKDDIVNVEQLDLSEKTLRALKTQRINTVAELTELIKDKSTAENILGIKAVEEILDILEWEED